MKTTTCDICKKEITGREINVTVNDGEDGHKGNIMTTRIDVCKDCLRKIPDLKSRCELCHMQQGTFM